jgi:hypothetical protein
MPVLSLLKSRCRQAHFLYNQTNSGLESLTFAGPNYFDVRINGAALHKRNLWVTNSR